MKYKITIEEVIESTDSKYSTTNTIYEQVVETLTLNRVILAVNNME